MSKFGFIKSIGDLFLADLKAAIIGRLSSVETKIDGLNKDMDKLDGGVSEIKNEVKSLNCRTFKLESAAIEIQNILQMAGASVCQKLSIGPGSPLKLMPYGEEIAKDVDAYKFVEVNKDFLFQSIENKNHKTPYDVQEASMKVLREYLSNPIMDAFKSYAFSKGIRIDDILDVAGIILRDEYLKAHPEIK
ncbi:MAG: hypothetical protein WC619_01785 [Patescibacteria group bacterium]